MILMASHAGVKRLEPIVHASMEVDSNLCTAQQRTFKIQMSTCHDEQGGWPDGDGLSGRPHGSMTGSYECGLAHQQM